MTGLCTERFASEQQVSSEGYTRLRRQRQIIVPHLRFMCNGRVTRLIVSTEKDYGPDPLIFQIWQPTGNTTYRLSGMPIELPQGVVVDDRLDDFLLVNFSIPANINLFFHHGDVVGYYQPDDLRARIWTIRNSSYVAYELRANNFTRTFDIDDESVRARDDQQPLIHVIYGNTCKLY